MTAQPLDASGQVRAALHAIAKDYGAAALSNPQFLNSMLRDMVPDSPREASVLVTAAEADVADILQERAAQHISTGTAVAQAAATLGERTALAPEACQWAASELAEALGLPQAASVTPGTGAAATAAPGRGAVPPHKPPRLPARKGASATSRVAMGAVAAAAVVYLVVAGAAHLPPFSHSKHGFTPTAADSALLRLIPAKIKTDHNCKATPPAFGSSATIECATSGGIPTYFVDYALFASSAAMNTAYTFFVTQVAHTHENAGNCGNLTIFSPCEAPYGSAAPYTNGGRFVEYNYKGAPDMSFTVKSKTLFITMAGSDGNALLKWWKGLPAPWVSGGY